MTSEYPTSSKERKERGQSLLNWAATNRRQSSLKIFPFCLHPLHALPKFHQLLNVITFFVVFMCVSNGTQGYYFYDLLKFEFLVICQNRFASAIGISLYFLQCAMSANFWEWRMVFFSRHIFSKKISRLQGSLRSSLKTLHRIYLSKICKKQLFE